MLSVALEGPLFDAGMVVVTEGVLELQERYGLNIDVLLACHTHGEWGDVTEDDWQANNRALREGGRLVSIYLMPIFNGETALWVITEANRSATTVSLPGEFY